MWVDVGILRKDVEELLMGLVRVVLVTLILLMSKSGESVSSVVEGGQTVSGVVLGIGASELMLTKAVGKFTVCLELHCMACVEDMAGFGLSCKSQ